LEPGLELGQLLADAAQTNLSPNYPCIRGWISYYGHFYKTQLRPTLKRIDV
jgi:hypothetical protein